MELLKLECKNCGHVFDAETVPAQCPVCQTGEKDVGSNCPNCGFEILESEPIIDTSEDSNDDPMPESTEEDVNPIIDTSEDSF
jgi:predicted Zn-ribbon and HTH transcriptional regulator